MRQELEKFIEDNITTPGKALDLGAGDLVDVEGLKKMGWMAEGVDLKTGTNLEEKYLSPRAPFDLVFSNHVLHYLVNKQALIESAYENLKTGGWLYFCDLIRSELTTDMYWPKEDIEKLITNNGFEIVNSRIFNFFDDKPEHMHWHDIVEIYARKL